MKHFVRIIYAQLSDKLGRISRKLWRNKYERSKLTNKDFTIFSQNCIGGIMYHDLGLQFCSPTVNLLFTPKNFIKLMKDIHWYLEQEIEFVQSGESYPVGNLGGGVEIRFLHYHSEEEALRAWNARKQRINWNNVFVICCDEGLTYGDMQDFDNLPYKHKILFTHNYLPEIKSAVHAQMFKDKTDARLLIFANPLGKRYYQNYLNYVKWINGSFES